MKKFLAALFILCVACSPAWAQFGSTRGPSQFDPFTITPPEGLFGTGGEALPPGNQSVNGLSYRNQTINTSKRNLVLIMMGQSNCENVNPTLYVPTNSSVIDEFNIYDGASYNINGPLAGASNAPTGGPYGPGNVGARLADTFISNNIFDRVILASICIGSSTAADWTPSGVLSNRVTVIFNRLKQRGMVPGGAGLTFAISWWQGETDGCIGTTESQYIASMNQVLASAQASGFTQSSSRFFVNVETLECGTSATIQAAQAQLASNGGGFFAGGNVDTLGAPDRVSDGIHFNDTGAAAATTLVFNAMHASGSPY